MSASKHAHRATNNAAAEIPPDAVLMDDAQAVLAASVSWLPAKNYGAVKTFVPHDSSGAALHWHCAVSEFRANQTPFARIWDKLGRNQVQHQQRSVLHFVSRWRSLTRTASHLSGLMKVARVRYISELQSIWTTLFSAVAPLSPRIYTIYQTSWLVEYSHRQRGCVRYLICAYSSLTECRIIVTLPVDLSRRDIEDISDLEERGIRGRYVAIEHLQEIDGDVIEWRRVSCRDPGGMIPKCWVQRHMGHAMAKVGALHCS